MYMKYVRLLFLICASVMYVGCSEDPFDWSGDSERSVPIPVNLIYEYGEYVMPRCDIEYHDDDLPILEVGFFYGDNSNVTYSTGERVISTIRNDGSSFLSDNVPFYWEDVPWESKGYCYVGAYITTSRGTVTIGPIYVERV